MDTQINGTVALNDEQKRWLVLQHASFRSNREIRAAWLELWPELGDLSPRLVSYYNPSLPSSGLCDELRTLHKTARERFIADVTEIPIANKTWRLEQLQNIVEGRLPRGVSPALVLEALDAARIEIEGRNPRLSVSADASAGEGLKISVVYEDIQL